MEQNLTKPCQKRVQIPTAVPKYQVGGKDGIEVRQCKMDITLVRFTPGSSGIPLDFRAYTAPWEHVFPFWLRLEQATAASRRLVQKKTSGTGSCPREKPPSLMDHFHGVASFVIQCQS